MTCQECKQELVPDGVTHVGPESMMRCPGCGGRYLISDGMLRAMRYFDRTRKGDHYG